MLCSTLGHNTAIAQSNLIINALGILELIKEFEGFHLKPYWDFQQWSWGFGTRAPGQHGTTEQATAA